MNTRNYPVSVDKGLQFFGRITASISHEIKNCLAIMNENAGLLQDLLALQQNGKRLDPERVERIAGQVAGQIQRADQVVKKLNQFAHSADEMEKTVNLEESLALATALNYRLAVTRGVTLRFTPTGERYGSSLSPYLLQYLLGHCLETVSQLADGKQQLEIKSGMEDDEIIVMLDMDPGMDTGQVIRQLQDQAEISPVLDALRCRLDHKPDQNRIFLTFQRGRNA